MKKTVILISILIALDFTSCNPKSTYNLTQELKDQAIKKIKKQLSDANSYNSLTWGPLDTLSRLTNGNKDIDRLTFVIDSLNSCITNEAPATPIRVNLQTYKTDINTRYQVMQANIKRRGILNRQIDSLISEKTELLNNMPRKQVGWDVKHKFSTTGKMGTTKVLQYIIYLNKDKTKVDSVSDVTEIMRSLEKINQKK